MTALTAPRRGRRVRATAGCERPRGAGTGTGTAAWEPTLFDELCDDRGSEPTLDEVVSGVWEGLAARQRVPCPWCGGEMTPQEGAHAHVAGGRCGDCGTTLG